MHHSIWRPSPSEPLEPLRADAQVDVCVIGAGVAGLTTAYLLAREGRSVLVLDDGPIGGGETSHTTAQLVTALDRGWQAIVHAHGVERASLAAASHRAAIDRIEHLIREETITCYFARVEGYLLSGRDPDQLREEHAAVQSVGIPGVDWSETNRFDGGAALRYPDQAQLDPLLYLGGLARAVQKYGGRIAGTRAAQIDGSPPHMVVHTAAGMDVHAHAVVVATNAPLVANIALSLKQAAYRTYVVAGHIPPGALPTALYWDTEEPFHYVRLLGSSAHRDELLLVGGEDHRTGQEDESAAVRYGRLVSWVRQRVPAFGEVVASWSGQVLESMDGLGLIGLVQPGIFVVTGDSGTGMTHAMVAGLLISDAVQGRANPWREVYDPQRARLRAGVEFVRENANTAAQYVGLVTGGDVNRVDDVAPGVGAIIRRGLKKIAAYRDPEGRLHECSAICPHLGCVVQWNGAETSWDCPCHGSRFDAYGHLLNGPANQDLAPVATQDAEAVDSHS